MFFFPVFILLFVYVTNSLFTYPWTTGTTTTKTKTKTNGHPTNTEAPPGKPSFGRTFSSFLFSLLIFITTSVSTNYDDRILGSHVTGSHEKK
jgi:YbbR domain-containing protein